MSKYRLYLVLRLQKLFVLIPALEIKTKEIWRQSKLVSANGGNKTHVLCRSGAQPLKGNLGAIGSIHWLLDLQWGLMSQLHT